MSESDTTSQTSAASTADSSENALERKCPECNEMVRRGLVRCWNCGGFMDEAVRARYQELQENPAPTIFSEVPEGEVSSFEDSLSDEAEGDDGFVLKAAQPAPTSEAAPQEAESPGDAETAHSVATAGDVLFQAALQEQAEKREKRRKRPAMTGGAKTPGGFIIFCPYGCRIEVKEQHRGMQGKCPRCRARFLVPIDPPDYVEVKKKSANEGTEPGEAAAAATVWLDDLHVHTVPPEKLKLKADSLLKEFAEWDFGVSAKGVTLVNLSKKAGGLFGGGEKKDETRSAVRQYLNADAPQGEFPGGERELISPEQVQELRVVQPTASRATSLFQGIPIFGEGRIAIQLPIASDDAPPRYVSLGILQFRQLAAALKDCFGIENFGHDCGIPATDEFEEMAMCHYLNTPVKGLKNLEFYRADPTAELVLAGWKCAACSMVVSEDGRQKEKLGGKGGKGIAKTKCPKCKQKFGDHPLYTLAEQKAEPSMESAAAESETETADS